MDIRRKKHSESGKTSKQPHKTCEKVKIMTHSKNIFSTMYSKICLKMWGGFLTMRNCHFFNFNYLDILKCSSRPIHTNFQWSAIWKFCVSLTRIEVSNVIDYALLFWRIITDYLWFITYNYPFLNLYFLFISKTCLL